MERALERLRAWAGEVLGAPLAEGVRLPGGGSRRSFYRFAGPGRTAVAVIGSDRAENRAFLAFTRHFAARGIPVPGILGADEESGFYLMEDLGDATLADRLREWRAAPGEAGRAMAALREVVRRLARIQVEGGEGLDYRLCHEGEALDGPLFQADVERFLAEFGSGPEGAGKESVAVQAELDGLVKRLDAVERRHFCYRDFQPRNVMWPGRPVFIDYQAGRRGALQYDLAALLYSPDSGLEGPEREALREEYLEALGGCGISFDREEFLADFPPFVLIRRLQALAAYARLEREKPLEGYGEKIPAALGELARFLEEEGAGAGFPVLQQWLRGLEDSYAHLRER